jgi:8-oxo-dGTP pyrophosphatase MutT (NUDIX family)
MKPWETLSSRFLGDYRIFRLWQHTRRAPRSDQSRPFFVIESVDWVNIIPVTSADEVVLIEQFRHGTQEITLEVPGGMVDPEDPSPEVAARREMVEECGFDSDSIIHLGSMTPNPALFDNRLHTFLALDSRIVSAPNPGAFEETAVQLVPLRQVPELIRSGRISHALVVAAFHLYELYLSKAVA